MQQQVIKSGTTTLGFGTLIFIILLVARLCGVAVPWFWVFFPLWAPIVLSAGVLLLLFAVLGILAVVAASS